VELDDVDDLKNALANRTARIVVVGLGYVGLPLALRVAEAGFEVTGLDQDPKRVALLAAGRSPNLEIDDQDVSAPVENGRFRPVDDPTSLSQADVVVICVPTPLTDGSPELEHVESAGRCIAQHLRPGQLVILESTTYPGTTEDLLRGILESGGLKAGVDFHLGFSPERIDPGNPTFQLANVPKIIGGFDPQSADLMELFYGSFVDTVVRVSSAKAAEMAKLLENTYRHVNIALVNEMAILCHDLGIDIWEVVDAAATKPFGFQPFYPGPGWGGHCIPVDPAYLSWRVRQMGSTARFVELAREFNETMPTYVLQRLSEALQERETPLERATILVLGVAYKPDVNDARESPAIQIINKLHSAGAMVRFHDPYVRTLKVASHTMTSCELTPETLAGADLVVFHTSHSTYDAAWLAEHSRLIFDTRNYFKGVRGPIVTL
jgi:UDP-N-acetyl-D-glucosamine dehydrogenase